MTATRFEITAQHDFAEGASFGEHGPYQRIEGRVHFEVDPSDRANHAIVDLEHAINSGDRHVRFSADFSLVTPKEPARGSRKLLIDVPNRGNRLTAATLHRVPAVLPGDRLKPGDGFLCHRGWSYLAVGWQWDAEGDHALRLHPPIAMPGREPATGPVLMKLQPMVDRPFLALAALGQTAPSYPVHDPESPANRLFVKTHDDAPREEIPREHWHFAREKEGRVTRSDRHILLKGGFEKGKIYELVYETRGAPVVGAGLLAVRDAASCIRYGDAASIVPDEFEHTYAFGVSQTGRFLRQFLYDGLNVDERRRPVFDGMWLHIAGAQRGDFNFRFAQPTVATVPSLGQRFPFSTTEARDRFSARTGSLLENLSPEARPKIIISNTSYEYWRGDASLAHIDGEQDLATDDSTRIYAIAGTHHIGGVLVGGKQIKEVAATGLAVEMPLNVVNFAPVSRALVVMLDDWVARDIEPAPSRHPRIDDGTAATRESVLEAFSYDEDIALLAPDKLTAIRYQVPTPGNDAGLVEQPVEEGDAYPCYVSALDDDLNEVAGIRLPDIACPLGVHTGWNPRAKGTGAEDQAAIFAGFTRFFSRAEIEERYGSEHDYIGYVTAYVDTLIAERFVLGDDRDWLIELARDRYRAATA